MCQYEFLWKYVKKKWVSFVRSEKKKREREIKDLHTNIWGPTQVSSLGGSHYFFTCIDDITRKVWIYFLRNKCDVFQTLNKWKCLVENEIGKNLKCLRSDNGSEYCSNEFDYYFSTNGICRQKTIPKTPEENRVVEHMNMTIMENARSMRFHVGMPINMWAKAINTH